jgi:glyceraldehyde-3-phosphate dehydrogenase/erythrose-4-phosphate dehydrogenase
MKSMKPFRYAAQHNLKGILDYTEDPIVSVDIIGIKTHAYLTHN